MPKTYSESERIHIRNRLMEEARQCLQQYGVRRTTVDELVKRVNIPKGTFYLFYVSKEMLFFDVLMEFHDEIQKELLGQITGAECCFTPDLLCDVIFQLYCRVNESFLYPMLTNGEIEVLMRKLPPEIVQAHMEHDDLNLEQLIAMLPFVNTNRLPVFSGALRGIFLSMLHKREIGEDVFSDALRIMVRGVVLQLFEEKESRNSSERNG